MCYKIVHINTFNDFGLCLFSSDRLSFTIHTYGNLLCGCGLYRALVDSISKFKMNCELKKIKAKPSHWIKYIIQKWVVSTKHPIESSKKVLNAHRSQQGEEKTVSMNYLWFRWNFTIWDKLFSVFIFYLLFFLKMLAAHNALPPYSIHTTSNFYFKFKTKNKNKKKNKKNRKKLWW